MQQAIELQAETKERAFPQLTHLEEHKSRNLPYNDNRDTQAGDMSSHYSD